MKGIIFSIVLSATMLVACGTPLPTAAPTTAVEPGQATIAASNHLHLLKLTCSSRKCRKWSKRHSPGQ